VFEKNQKKNQTVIKKWGRKKPSPALAAALCKKNAPYFIYFYTEI